ncbi:MAG: DUF1592 domain-containing protein [Polyangiaceae bacterium]
MTQPTTAAIHSPPRSRTPRIRSLCAGLLAVFVTAQGCGDGGSGNDGPPGPKACSAETLELPPVPLRRLTSRQFNNTLRDLVGDPDFEADVDDTDGLITERIVRQYRDAAEDLTQRREQWQREVFPCDISGDEDLDCLANFIQGFGGRAFRRPPTVDEQKLLTDMFEAARGKDLSFEDAMLVVFEMMLQSPALLYLHEVGGANTTDSLRLLTDHEVASRLSYFLWETMPDDDLFGAAAAGKLGSEDGLREEVQRMLGDPRAEATVQRFFAAWLQLEGGHLHDALEITIKDKELFPNFEGVPQAMRRETEALIHRAFFEEDENSFATLLTSRDAYVNGALSELYGVDGPKDDESFEWVTLDGKERAGLLTRAAFLTVYASSKVQSPIKRGAWIYREALGGALGDPPANVNDNPPLGGEALTIREDVEARTKGAECSGCHTLINPLGFTFGHYDAIGRFQTEEIGSGETITAEAEVQSTGFDGVVADAVGLSTELADSIAAREHFANRWMSLAFAGGGSEELNCESDPLRQGFVDDGDMRKLVVSVISSNTFRYVAIPTGDPQPASSQE